MRSSVLRSVGEDHLIRADLSRQVSLRCFEREKSLASLPLVTFSRNIPGSAVYDPQVTRGLLCKLREFLPSYNLSLGLGALGLLIREAG